MISIVSIRDTIRLTGRGAPISRVSIAALAAFILCCAEIRGAPSIYPTGVTRYDPSKACNVYLLFCGSDKLTHLIDMDGNEAHRWNYPGMPSGMIDPALIAGQRGHVMVQLSAMTGNETGAVPGMPDRLKDKTIGEVDWDGKTVWQWGEQAPGGAAQQHHDWARLANGNTLVLSILKRRLRSFTRASLFDDAIYEVTPNGEIVWRWLAGDHLHEFGFTKKQLALVHKSEEPDYLHVNTMKPLGANHWFREGDARFNPDNIIINSRNANFIAIIDKQTGHVVWRLGPDYPARPDGRPVLPKPVDQMSGEHDPQILPEGLPGAGNLLVFDNQGEAGYPAAKLPLFAGSRVLEIDPIKRQIVWEYTGSESDRPEWTFYSSFISDARRLPNGNTFIDEGMNGRFFQVTPRGEIVWEYVSPFFGKGNFGPGGRDVEANAVYRAQPVPYDWAPAGTPHDERPVIPPDLSTFHVPRSQ
jgi:hypothetical protein